MQGKATASPPVPGSTGRPRATPWTVPDRTGTGTGTSTTWIGGRGADRDSQGADRDGALTSGEEREVPGGGDPAAHHPTRVTVS